MARRILVELDVRTAAGAAALRAFSQQLQAVQKQAAFGNSLTNASTASRLGLPVSTTGPIPDIESNQALVTRQRQLQGLGNTIRTTTDLMIANAAGEELFSTKLRQTTGNFSDYIRAQQAYGQGLERDARLSDIATRANQRLADSFDRQFRSLDRRNAAGRAIDASGRFVSEATRAAQLQAALPGLQAQLAAGQARVASRIDPLRQAINLPALQAAVANAFNAAPPLPAGFDRIPNSLMSRLIKEGLGAGAPLGSADFARNAFNKNALDVNIEKDLVRQLNRVSGSFIDTQGNVKRFNAEFTDSGRVITRFGGQLSGVGNILSQIGRDFQKVIEFAIATTVVFGTLRYTMEQIGKINTIEKLIRQFSITANLSREQGFALFADIADIAIATATPVEELVKATDDIALATREAGQSTQDWHADILQVTEAVGILTNLAGIDTVKATDLLVASMKQLNLESEQLPGLLNKVTAVAGGQSTAIADVIQGLGAMAEAGKQAGLSIDEMIATVQVLSQVTSKSPAEVATSFKNLVGALTGKAGRDALKDYNIALLDEAGNLRNILDIYGEISDKIASGIIPQNQVQALVRAIAGGPRRAPDAAALLGSIGDVQEVTTRSLNATNEALIANAKILDTTNAKLTQLQARVDKFAVTKFADILRGLTDSLLDVVNGVLSILELIPPQLVIAVIQFGLLAAAVKFSTVVFGGLRASIVGTLASIRTLIPELRLLAATQNQVARAGALGNVGGVPVQGPVLPASFTRGQTARNIIRNNLGTIGGIAAGAAITAGTTAASGGNLLETIGAGLQGAGLTAALSVPIPQIKLLGVAAAGLGFILQGLAGNFNEVEEESKGSTEELLNALSAYKDASLNVESIAKSQEQLAETIKRLQKQSKLTTDEQAQLTSAQKDYAAGVYESIKANSALTQSLKDVAEESASFPSYKLDAARAGRLDPKQVADLTADLAADILSKTNPEFQTPDEIGIPVFFSVRRDDALGDAIKKISDLIPVIDIPLNVELPPIVNEMSDTIATIEEQRQRIVGRFAEVITVPVEFDLRDLEDLQGDELRKKLTNILEVGDFVPNSENLDLLTVALQRLKDEIPESEFIRLNGLILEIANNGNLIVAITQQIAQYRAYLEAGGATGIFTQEDIDTGTALLNILQQVVELAPKTLPSRADVARTSIGGAPGGPEGLLLGSRGNERNTFTAEDAIARASNLVTNPETGQLFTEVDKKRALEIADLLLLVSGNSSKVTTEFEKLAFIGPVFSELGVEIDGVTNSIAGMSAAAAEANAELTEALTALKPDLLQDYTTKLAELQARFQGGEFKTKAEIADYTDEINQLKALQEQVEIVLTRAQEATDTINSQGQNVNGIVQELAASLTGINGLADAQNLTLDQLIGRLFSLAETYGLNGKQVDALGKRILNFIDVAKRIADIRSKFTIVANLDLKQAIVALKALKTVGVAVASFVPVFGAIAKIFGGGTGPSLPGVNLGAIEQAIRDLENAQNLGGGFSQTFGGGAGSSFGTGGGSGSGSSKKGPGKDVSTLDLPDEIANAANRDALIQEAIRRAKKLQAQIPGASKEAQNDIVELLKGTQRILEVRGVKDDLLRRALEELAEIEKKKLEFETKADTIRRIRVGGGDFSAIANVPLNSRTGVSVGDSNNINIILNVNGQVQTPAQLAALAELIAAALKRQLAR